MVTAGSSHHRWGRGNKGTCWGHQNPRIGKRSCEELGAHLWGENAAQVMVMLQQFRGPYGRGMQGRALAVAKGIPKGGDEAQPRST